MAVTRHDQNLTFQISICIYLIVIVVLSLMDSLVSSLIFSVIAAGTLNYYFTEPKFSLYIDSPTDAVALVTFFITTSFVNLVLNGIQAMVAVGLSICRSIIEAHGGEIWANPNPDGPGGTFSFGLPAVERSAVTQS